MRPRLNNVRIYYNNLIDYNTAYYIVRREPSSSSSSGDDDGGSKERNKGKELPMSHGEDTSIVSARCRICPWSRSTPSSGRTSCALPAAPWAPSRSSSGSDPRIGARCCSHHHPRCHYPCRARGSRRRCRFPSCCRCCCWSSSVRQQCCCCAPYRWSRSTFACSETRKHILLWKKRVHFKF